MSFSIEVISEPEIWEGELRCFGEMIIGDSQETFYMSLSFWTVEDYRQQWKLALKRIIESKKDTVLMQSMGDPETTRFFFWWTIYYEGEHEIYIHNNLIDLKELKSPLDLNNPYIHIDPRITVTEEGEPIVEWKTTISELKEFLEKLE